MSEETWRRRGRKGLIQLDEGLDQGMKCKRRLQKGKLVEIISCLVGQQHKDSE